MENTLVVLGFSIVGLVAFVLTRSRAPSRARNRKKAPALMPVSFLRGGQACRVTERKAS